MSSPLHRPAAASIGARLCRPAGVAALMAVALAGCVPENDVESGSLAAPKTLPVTHEAPAGIRPMACSPRAWQKLVGQNPADLRLPQALTYRVMARGSIITREYQENRLNIITGTDGRVIEVTCG